MVTLGSFRRRLTGAGGEAEVELQAGMTRWIAAQEHAGENIGDTDSHAIFIELKETLDRLPDGQLGAPLGPSPTTRVG